MKLEKSDICCFTICTISYIGIAETLRNSYLKYNKKPFYIILADADESECNKEYFISAKKIFNFSAELFAEMTFKYNITEFCTSIKPFAFEYLLKTYNYVFYFDPDIMFFNSIQVSKGYSIYLTPHITEKMPTIPNAFSQEFFLKFGIYNCGFVGFQDTDNALEFVEWWKNKLINYSYDDTEIGIYTDQKWIEYAFNFFPLIEINRIDDLGYDVAPWNFSERKIG